MKVSDKGLAFTAHSEGFEPTVYDDAGHKAIGYGHDLLPGEAFPNGITQEDALSVLRKDVAKAEGAVNQHIAAPLTQGQFDACCDFCYNVGIGAFEESTFLRLLNDKQYDAAIKTLYWEDDAGKPHGWIYSGGAVNQGLIGRRKNEQALFNS